MLRHLEDTKVDAKDVRARIAILPAKIVNEVYITVDNAAPALETKDTLIGLFNFLNALVWNFIDYHLLEYVLETYGSKELKSLMAKYVCDLKVFKRYTTVSQLMECWPGQVEVPEGFNEASAKINSDPNYFTIAEVDKLRVVIFTEFLPRLSKFTKFFIYYIKFKKGCFCITWMFPSSLSSELEKAAHKAQAFYKRNLISSFSVQNKEVYVDSSR